MFSFVSRKILAMRNNTVYISFWIFTEFLWPSLSPKKLTSYLDRKLQFTDPPCSILQGRCAKLFSIGILGSDLVECRGSRSVTLFVALIYNTSIHCQNTLLQNSSGIVHVGNCLERWCKIPTGQKKQLFFQPKKGWLSHESM